MLSVFYVYWVISYSLHVLYPKKSCIWTLCMCAVVLNSVHICLLNCLVHCVLNFTIFFMLIYSSLLWRVGHFGLWLLLSNCPFLLSSPILFPSDFVHHNLVCGCLRLYLLAMLNTLLTCTMSFMFFFLL